MMWGYYDGWSWVGMGSMMLLLWGGVAVLVVLAWRAFSSPRGGGQGIDVLRRRLASGEITREEFERVRRALHE